MTKTLTAVTAALMMLGAHSAFAANTPAKASTPTAQTCSSMETQYDSAMKTHANAKRASEARTAYTEGKKLCDEGKYKEGSAKLHTALNDLGVKATSKAH